MSIRSWPQTISLRWAVILIVATNKATALAALPTALLALVPTCAQDCLESFVEQDFANICASRESLHCLCSHYGAGGYVLGEGAYACLSSPQCDSKPSSVSTSLYRICDRITHAVTATHETVLYTPTSFPVTGSLDRTVSTQNTAKTPTKASLSTPGTTYSDMAQASVSAGAGGVSVSGRMNLTMAQIAGITIAAAALLILIIGILSCIFFVRRRNKRLELEDHKSSTQSTPRLPDVQQLYPPPPPAIPPAVRESKSIGLLHPRSGMKLDEDGGDQRQYLSPPTPQPRNVQPYCPAPPQMNIGVAVTAYSPVASAPAARKYGPVPTILPGDADHTTQVHASASSPSTVLSQPNQRSIRPTPDIGLSLSPTAATVALTFAPVELATQPAPQRERISKNIRRSRRQSKASSFMTDIEENERTEPRDKLISDVPDEASGEQRSPRLPTVRIARRPSLTIHIPNSRPAGPGHAAPPRRPSQLKALNAALGRRTCNKYARTKVPHTLLFPPPSQPPQARKDRPERNAEVVQASSSKEHAAALPKSTDNLAPREKQIDDDSHRGPSVVSPSLSSRIVPSRSSSDGTISPALPSSQVMAGEEKDPFFPQFTGKPSHPDSRRTQPTVVRRGSDTSTYTEFEETCEDGGTTPPKEELKKLSPVTESSPIAGLAYPKVPRGSNQAVPRSPGTAQSSLAGRWDSPMQNSASLKVSQRLPPPLDVKSSPSASQRVGNRLWKTEGLPDASGAVSGLTSRWMAGPADTRENWSYGLFGTDASREMATSTAHLSALSESTLQSPRGGLGEDRLRFTPKRRGDDLYLEMRV